MTFNCPKCGASIRIYAPWNECKEGRTEKIQCTRCNKIIIFDVESVLQATNLRWED
jgi:transcription elongation factor Elf1